MKRPIHGKQLPKRAMKLSDAQSIDMQYGFEPVIDPSVAADGGGPRGRSSSASKLIPLSQSIHYQPCAAISDQGELIH